MVKIEITRPGVFDKDGEELKVGTELSLPKEPKGWKNKYRLLKGEPSKDAKLEPGNDDLRAKYKELSGKAAAQSWDEEKLKKEIKALESDGNNS